MPTYYEFTEDSLHRRPRFAIGDRIRIVSRGMHYGLEATVTDVEAMQNLAGMVSTYVYKLRLDNLAFIKLLEDDLAPETRDSIERGL